MFNNKVKLCVCSLIPIRNKLARHKATNSHKYKNFPVFFSMGLKKIPRTANKNAIPKNEGYNTGDRYLHPCDINNQKPSPFENPIAS